MSMGVSESGILWSTSEDIQRDCRDLIQGLKMLLEYAEVEALKPADTPEILVKIRDMVDDDTVYTFQLSVANDIPLLCIDHLMIKAGTSLWMPRCQYEFLCGKERSVRCH